MKETITPLFRLFIVAVFMLFAAQPLQAAPDEIKPNVAIALSGGISLGSYEAGLNWAMIKYLENNQNEESGNRLKAVSGASAGSINALISAVVACAKAEQNNSFSIHDGRKTKRVENSVESNWFREIWLPIGFDELLPEDASKYDDEDGLLSRHAFNRLFNNLDRYLHEAAFKPDCEVPITMMLTREQAGIIELNPESASSIKVKNARFSLSMLFKVDAMGRAGFYTQVPVIKSDESLQASNQLYLPGQLVAQSSEGTTPGQVYELLFYEDYTGKALKDRRYDRVADVILASSAFPMAFGKKKITYCGLEVSSADVLDDGDVCPEGMAAQRSSFVDGGVFDNVPLAVLEEDMRTVKNKRYIFLDPDYRRPLHIDKSSDDNSKENHAFGLLSQLGFLGDTVKTARQYELFTMIKYHGDEFRNSTRVPDRFFPLTASYFGNFGAFWGKEFREFDYAVGVYDGIYFLASLACDGDKTCMPETFKKIYNSGGKSGLGIKGHAPIDVVIRKIAHREFMNHEHWLGEQTDTYAESDMELVNNQLRIFDALDDETLGPYDHLNAMPVVDGKKKSFKGFIHALKESDETEAPFKPESEMLQRIMRLSDWGEDAWLNPVTSRLADRQLALEEQANKKFKLANVIALGVNTKYRDVLRPFTRSTAPRGSWQSLLMPYEIGADVSNGGLLASWEGRIPLRILGDAAISLKVTPLIWNRNQTGISRTGQLDMIASYGFDNLAFSSFGVGPSINMNYNKNLGQFKKFNYGGMAYVGMFADKFRISFGMRSFKRNHYAGDRAYISIGVTDVPGIFYWLSQ